MRTGVGHIEHLRCFVEPNRCRLFKAWRCSVDSARNASRERRRRARRDVNDTNSMIVPIDNVRGPPVARDGHTMGLTKRDAAGADAV